jgi:hypothetical protein
MTMMMIVVGGCDDDGSLREEGSSGRKSEDCPTTMVIKDDVCLVEGDQRYCM